MNKIRVIIADDERPARMFLRGILQEFAEVEIIGEAENGTQAIEIIKQLKPDLALLDLQMPETTGIEVVKSLSKKQLPLIAFVTAYDDFAIQAFELNAIDYLLKPIEIERLRQTIERVKERFEEKEFRLIEAEKLKNIAKIYKEIVQPNYLERIPVKLREEIILVNVNEVTSIVADGELLHIKTVNQKKFTINHRLKDLESRLNPSKFIRLSRGALVNLEMISHINPMMGGTYSVNLKSGEEIPSSRLQSKILREKFFKI